MLDMVSSIIEEIPGMLIPLRDNPVIYRAMKIDDIDEFIAEVKKTGKTDVGCVGTYWAFDADHAIAYMGDTGKEYILVAVINPDDVNVFETITSYVIYSTGPGEEAGREDEITMKNGAKVRIVEIIDKVTGKSRKVNIEACA